MKTYTLGNLLKDRIMNLLLIVTSLLLASLCHLSSPSVAQTVGQNQAVGEVQGRNHVGGLIGGSTSDSLVISNSFARGDVSGSHYVGGLAGSTGAAIEHTYSTGAVSGAAHVGGLAGQASAQVSYSYWNTITSGLDVSDGGMGRNTSEMTHPYASNTYEGWDFEVVWAADPAPAQNDGYPILRGTEVYELRLAVYPLGAGTASGAGFYPAGMQVEAVAIPEAGYQFDGWRHDGDQVSADHTHLLSLTTNTLLTAVFSTQTTSVHEPILAEQPKVSIHPNPTRGHCTITFEGTPDAAIMQIGVYNMLGSRVFSYEGPAQLASTVSLDDQRPGVYLVVVRSGRHRVTQKLVKQ
jgi:hypothetical protein